jgi:hypothetical protein
VWTICFFGVLVPLIISCLWMVFFFFFAGIVHFRLISSPPPRPPRPPLPPSPSRSPLALPFPPRLPALLAPPQTQSTREGN